MAWARSFRCGVVRYGSVLVGFLALALPGVAFGGSFSMLLESNADAMAGDEVYEISYGSLADVYSNTEAGEGFTNVGIGDTYSIGGFAFDGQQFHILVETNDDGSAGAEVYIASYDSLADVYVHNMAGGAYTAMNVNAAFSVGGFTYDGSQYHLILESDNDASGGAEVFLISYASLADVFSNTSAGADYTAMNVNADFSVAGFAFDGDQYHIVLESNDDAASGAEVFIVSYNSLADVHADIASGFGYSALNVNSVWGIGGFAGGTGPFEDGFETGDTSRWTLTVP